MNTAEIINSMKEHVAAAYTAVTEKSGTIPEQKNLSNLAAAINSIQVGSSAENPYKARTYSEMNSYRTKNYGNAYVEYTGQRQFTRDQIQNNTIYDKLYFDFPRQIGWIETLDWDNPDKITENSNYILKEIHPFDVTIIDNTSKEEYTSPFVWARTEGISGEVAGLKAYSIYWYTDTVFWSSYGGTPDKEFKPYNAKLKVSNIKQEYYYLIGDTISTTGEWSQIMDGTQFGYKHGTYKIDTNSKTVDNFQKLDLVLEDGGGGTARKTITNDYSYNLDSYYDYILKYSYEGKSSSILCKVGNFSSEGHIIEGAKQLYNTTSDGEPAGIFFSLDTNCPLPYGWNSGLIVDNLDLSTGQSASNKSVVGVNSNLYTLVGKTVTIDDISTAADMIYYTTLPSLSTPAAATDIVKGKQAIDAEGNRINGTFEPVVLPTLTNEGTAADLAQGKQLISSSGEIVTGTATAASETGTGDFWVKVIDYNGTVLLEKHGNTGDIIDLPTAPTHEKLVFQEWSASVAVSDNKVTIADNDIMVGAVYTTASGQNEFDITLTKATGLSVTLKMDGTKDWGDGTSDTATSHTYTVYGDYTIKCDGTKMTTSDNSGLFGQSNSTYNYYCTSARLATVTNIGIRAFQSCYSLTSVIISNVVTSIGSTAFYSCYSLISIVIPNSITSINDSAFSNCKSLISVVIPNSVKSISEFAFQFSWSLTSIVIPNEVTSISITTFKNCYSLTRIVIPNSMTSIGTGVFNYCYSLASVVIPNSITSISGTFDSCCSLTNVEIPSSVMTIGNYAFADCYSIIKYDFSQHTSVPILSNTNVFTNINKICKIIVPDSLYDEWIAASNWSTYADYIYKASEVIA